MDIVSIILNILTSGLPACLVALGIFISYRLLDMADLTCEGSILVGGAGTLSLIVCGVNPFLATLIGALFGAICGLITGLLITKLHIAPLLAGIITMTACTSIAFIIIGWSKEGQIFANLVAISDEKTIFDFIHIFKGKLAPLNEIIVSVIIVILVVTLLYYFFGTEVGMSIRATGMNAQMARAQGINTTFVTILGLVLSNFVIALGGSLFAQDLQSMEIKSASGFLVIGLASIILGESIFGRKTFKRWIISVTLGGIVYYTIITIAIELGFPTNLKNLLYALLITIALCVPLIKKIFRKKGEATC